MEYLEKGKSYYLEIDDVGSYYLEVRSIGKKRVIFDIKDAWGICFDDVQRYGLKSLSYGLKKTGNYICLTYKERPCFRFNPRRDTFESF